MFTSLIGQGYSDTITPPVIQRNVLENPAWYTAYTPYQPEISQGRLRGAPQLPDDGERPHRAWTWRTRRCSTRPPPPPRRWRCCTGSTPKAGDTFFVDAECHPQTIDVVRTRAEPLGIDVVVGDPDADVPARGRVRRAAAVPRHHRRRSATTARSSTSLHAQGALVAVATDLLALVLLAPPGEWGADVVVGSAQRFGVPMGYGGPHAAFFATRDAYKRNLPGRLVGVSVDAAGRPALRLALQTREQHIRREKATSNICTAQVLLANIAGLYAVYHGPDGLRAIAERVHALTRDARRRCAAGADVHDTFFDTVARARPRAPTTRSHERATRGINLRRIDDDTVGIALDETTTPEIVGACARDPRRARRIARTRPRRDPARRCGARPTSSRTRCSARTTPRRRCCATCAGSPTATSRSTAR